MKDRRLPRQILSLMGILLICLILQVSDILVIKGIKPDLLLILSVCFSLNQGAQKGAIFGFIAGLLEDIFSAAMMGMNALTKTLIAFFVGWYSPNFFKENLIVSVVIVFIASIFHNLAIFILSNLWGLLGNPDWGRLIDVFLFTSLYNIALTPFILIWLQRVSRSLK